MNKKIIIQTGDTVFYKYDRELGFWGKPNIEKYVTFSATNTKKEIYVSHNNEGNRDCNYNSKEINNPIICLGGSHTWGGGVDQDERYTDFLNQKMGKQVLNFGHCSLGLDQICIFILQRALRFRPSVIVIEQYPWSISRILNTYINGYVKPYFYIDNNNKLKLNKNHWSLKLSVVGKSIGLMHKYKKEIQEFKAGIDIQTKYDPLTDPIFLYWKISFYDYLYLLTEKILNVIRDFTEENDIKLLFALGLVKQQLNAKNVSSLVDYKLPRNRLVKLLDDQNIDYVDASEKLIDSHSNNSPVIFPDGHPNSRGHSLFSDIIFNKLKENKWT